jgi:tRNA(Ile)-lysidine synthase
MTRTASKPAASDGVTRALAERFAAELTRLWPEGGRLGLAVSGGPDSLALLLLAEKVLPGRFEVATVDHGLRAEAAAECELVAQACSERGIACEILSVTVNGGNLQAAAREARYFALAAWAETRGLSAIATAHHADDQAETLLMRLNRSSGLSGLAGVREESSVPTFDAPVIRPLLRFRRSELAMLVEEAGLVAVQDPSNLDDRFDRVRIRKALANCDWLDPLALTASAAHLADANEAIEYAFRRLWNERVSRSDNELRYRPPVPTTIELRIVQRAILSFGKEARGQDVARLVERLRSNEGGNLGGVLVTVEEDEWVFRPEPPRRS